MLSQVLFQHYLITSKYLLPLVCVVYLDYLGNLEIQSLIFLSRCLSVVVSNQISALFFLTSLSQCPLSSVFRFVQTELTGETLKPTAFTSTTSSSLLHTHNLLLTVILRDEQFRLFLRVDQSHLFASDHS